MSAPWTARRNLHEMIVDMKEGAGQLAWPDQLKAPESVTCRATIADLYAVLGAWDRLAAVMRASGRRARSDGQRTFDDCISDLAAIDDLARGVADLLSDGALGRQDEASQPSGMNPIPGELKALSDAALSGPWEVIEGDFVVHRNADGSISEVCEVFGAEANAAFIVACVNHVRQALAKTHQVAEGGETS